MKQTIIIDPVTRIEGHLKIALDMDTDAHTGKNRVRTARASGTMFRGMEKILEGRDAFDAPIITARVCGVCPVSHAYAASIALESSAAFTPPKNARLVRNLILAANFLQSHILHFYHLSLLDFMQGPSMPPWRPASKVDMRFNTVESEELFKHYDLALDMRRKTHSMGAIFGGHLPHPASIIPGGVTAVVSRERIDQYQGMLKEISQFGTEIYASDVELLAHTYPDYLQIGGGPENLIAYGVFVEEDSSSVTSAKRLFPGGVLFADGTREALDSSQIMESVACSWYEGPTGATHPGSSKASTTALYPKSGAYSWTKSPRYKTFAMEAGAFARMKIAGLFGSEKRASVITRHQARVLEAKELVRAMGRWLEQLEVGGAVYEALKLPASVSGFGALEAPRGALGHWFTLVDGKFTSYQIITPTCINASPADEKGLPGAMEAALAGTVITDSSDAVEALRVVHSFDPCLACAVH
ncbi:MAG: nickel-dependent hydrogenase large subunit [Oligoflexia bacterium]|nr:nickel-dependent hydrogenase large subunit [Oligoflexia bacterium]